MHSAPAVTFPVGRSRFQAGVLLSLLVLGGVAGGLWQAQLGTWGWRQNLFLASLAVAALFAVDAWRRRPQGHLRWDGQLWYWDSAHAHRPAWPLVHGGLALHLDLQFFMLLRLCPEQGPALWLWLDRGPDIRRWRALRRAVFCTSNRPAGAQAARDSALTP